MAVDIETREFHEVVYIWPEMQPDEYEELREDIRTYGLKEDIWAYQGEIIDGRHRYLACRETGVEPRYREWNGKGSLVLFVASLNQHRRDMDAGQRAIAAVEIEEMLAKEAKERRGGRPLKQIEEDSINTEKPPTKLSEVSEEPQYLRESAHQAGAVTGASGTYVKTAKGVKKDVPELVPLVKKRTIKLTDAKRLSKKTEDIRETIVDRIVSGEAKTVKEAELQIIKENIDAQAQAAESKPLVTLAPWEEWLPGQEPADLLITDPPYTTDIDDIEAFANAWLPLALTKVKPTGRAYVCIGAYPEELRAYLHVPGCLPVAQVLVWSYRNTLGPSPKHDYKLNWQAILYFKGPDAEPLNFDIMTMNEQFSSQTINAPDGRQGDRYHAWQKPMELAEQLIRHSTRPGDRVIDCFTGTGTFLLAAHKLGRIASGCEQSPDMAELARTRGCEVING